MKNYNFATLIYTEKWIIQRKKPLRLSYLHYNVDMRKEYHFSKGMMGKYAKRYKEGTNIVVLYRT
jgi:hypothetical protein